MEDKIRIVCIVDGKFSVHPVFGPVLFCKKGKIFDLPKVQAQMLVDSRWANIILDSKENIAPKDDCSENDCPEDEKKNAGKESIKNVRGQENFTPQDVKRILESLVLKLEKERKNKLEIKKEIQLWCTLNANWKVSMKAEIPTMIKKVCERF